MMASMRDWLKGPHAKKGKVVVVHCKAGKGRSGTVTCSYLISEEGWTKEDALSRFTERRMRSGFGAGVSIPSQLRWISYVERWTKHRKLYFEWQIEILEVHAWGLREGVKVEVNGYVDGGKTIKTFHEFGNHERILVDGVSETEDGFTNLLRLNDEKLQLNQKETAETTPVQAKPSEVLTNTSPDPTPPPGKEPGAEAVIFRPSSRIVLPSNDVNIAFERRNKPTYGWAMVTSVSHVWFNAFFEGRGPENHGDAAPSGVFEIEWDAMDGIKGSARKGMRCLDRLAVVWRTLPDEDDGQAGAPLQHIISEPEPGEPVPDMPAADWKGANSGAKTAKEKSLGVRTASPASKSSSLPSVVKKDTTRKPDPIASPADVAAAKNKRSSGPSFKTGKAKSDPTDGPDDGSHISRPIKNSSTHPTGTNSDPFPPTPDDNPKNPDTATFKKSTIQ